MTHQLRCRIAIGLFARILGSTSYGVTLVVRRLARRHGKAGNALAGERVVRKLMPDPYLLQRRPVASFGEISPQTDQTELCSAHPDDMNPNEPATQALLASLRAQGAVDGDHWLHALIDPDLHRSKEARPGCSGDGSGSSPCTLRA